MAISPGLRSLDCNPLSPCPACVLTYCYRVQEASIQAWTLILPLWSHQQRCVECILDPGSQIVAISEPLCKQLGLSYNPGRVLKMESANGSVNGSLGVAVDVPFVIPTSDIILYLQMHVMRDAAYDVLLGRPFDDLASTIVETTANSGHRLTIRCPNTRKVAVVPTYDRGEGRPGSRTTSGPSAPSGF